MENVNSNQTLTIKIKASSSRRFHRAVEFIKNCGGTFDATSKTWSFPRKDWYQLYNNACDYAVINGTAPVFDSATKEWK